MTLEDAACLVVAVSSAAGGVVFGIALVVLVEWALRRGR